MGLKYVMLCFAAMVSLSACGNVQHFVRSPDSDLDVMEERPVEVETVIVYVAQEKQSQPKEDVARSQLKDIVLPESFKDKLPEPVSKGKPISLTEETEIESIEIASSDEEQLEESTALEEQIEDVSEVEESSDNSPSTDMAEQYQWDAELYKNLGVHAPSLDEWYKYEHSNIVWKNDRYTYLETGTEDTSKVLQIEMSKQTLEISTVLSDKQADLGILTKICKHAQLDDTTGEVLFTDTDIYYKITYTGIDADELVELITHIISYL